MSSQSAPTTTKNGSAEKACAEYMLHIATLVRGIRAQRGMSRKALAKHSGISERYLAKVETGEANMSISLLWRLADSMDVAFHDLLPNNAVPTTKLKPMSQFLKTLSLDQEQEAYDALLRHFSDKQGPVGGVALVGLRGAGKTTLGKILATEVGIPFFTLSEVIEQLAGMSLSEIFSLLGQKAYRRLERQALDHVLKENDNVVLEIGGSLVSEQETFAHLLQSFYTVWVQAIPEDHMSRVLAQGDTRPVEESSKAMDDLKLILSEREALYRAANYSINTSNRSVNECVDELTRQCRCFCCEWQWGR